MRASDRLLEEYLELEWEWLGDKGGIEELRVKLV